MTAFFNRSGIFLFPAISSIAFYLTILYEIPVAGFLFLIPLIYTLSENSASLRRLLTANTVYTGLLYLIILGWAPGVIQAYTGSNTVLTCLCYAAFVLIALVISNLLIGIYYLAIRKAPLPNIFSLLLLALFLFFQEMVMATLLPGMPWLTLHLAYTVIHADYILQWASIGGVYFISFCIANFNVLLFIIFRYAHRRPMIAALYLVFLLAGLLFGHYRLEKDNDPATGDPGLKIAVITENVPATTKWDAASVNSLVDTYFSLCRQALATQPDLIVWTESAVPWTYSPEDDFLDSLIRISRPYKVSHILGMNTEAGPGSVYNSAYFIRDGQVAGRQDKIYLLSFAEKPLFSFSLPFLQTEGFSAESGEDIHLFNVRDTRIGALICNESNVSGAALDMAEAGADLLINISNDSWFSDSPLLMHMHFKNARLRAVESGRPVIVNSNQGYCGYISGKGQVLDQHRHSSAHLATYTTHKKMHNTFYLNNKKSLILLLTLHSLIIYVLIRKKRFFHE